LEGGKERIEGKKGKRVLGGTHPYFTWIDAIAYNMH